MIALLGNCCAMHMLFHGECIPTVTHPVPFLAAKTGPHWGMLTPGASQHAQTCARATKNGVPNSHLSGFRGICAAFKGLLYRCVSG